MSEASLSPSFLAGPWRSPGVAGGSSYELKFLLTPAQAHQVEALAQQQLQRDPYAEGTPSGAYVIHSLYLDTADLDVFHQRPRYRRRKFRIRRYGAEHLYYLERKWKSGDRVAKRRTAIPHSELHHLPVQSTAPHGTGGETWAGAWFQRRILARRLSPRCLVSYERVALVGHSDTGPVRLTLDRHIRCAPCSSYHFDLTVPAVPLLSDAVILEFKYRTALPALFKGLMHDLGLNPAVVSKYRAAIEAWGSPQPAKEAG